MDEEVKVENNQYKGLTAVEVWERLYNKELNSKKHILEYIDAAKVLKKENAREEQIQDTYNFIYNHIEGLKDSIKPNTMMFLKNSLKSEFGKYVKEKDPRPVNHFMEFFKEAYPENSRRKDFAWALMDMNNMTEEQIWTTLVHINRQLLSNNFIMSPEQKKDVVGVIEKAVGKNNIKFINKIRSLKQLTEKLSIEIVSAGKGFKVRRK